MTAVKLRPRPFRPWLDRLEGRLTPAVVVWTGFGGDGNWSSTDNWLDGRPPDPNGADELVFGSLAGVFNTVNDFSGTLRVLSIRVDGDGYSFTGNDVALVDSFTAGAVTTTVGLALGAAGPVVNVTTAGKLDFGAPTNVGTSELVVTNQNGGQTTFASLAGTGRLVARGDGALLLPGDSTAFRGELRVDAGEASVGSNFGGRVFLAGGTLSGRGGTVAGIRAAVGSTVRPGPGTSILNSNGDVGFEAGSTFAVEVRGFAPGQLHDQLIVKGKVALGGSRLVVEPVAGLAPGVEVILIRNEGQGAVQGTFANFAPGAVVAVGAGFARVNYAGGDGNDVSLTFLDKPPPPSQPDLIAGDDSGVSNTDNRTRGAVLTFTGTAMAGATVTLFVDGTAAGTTTADANGRWQVAVDAPAGDGVKRFTAQVVGANGSPSDFSAPLDVTLDRAAPVVAALDLPGRANTPVDAVIAAFTDDPTDQYLATIAWGDGQVTPGTITVNPGGGFRVRGTHTYAAGGTFTAAVTVTDAAGNVGLDRSTITVTVAPNRPPAVNLGGTGATGQFQQFIRVASFTDQGPDRWTATVDFGDGSGLQPLALNADNTFTLAHVYPVEATFVVTVRVADGAGAVGADTFKVAVLPATTQTFALATAPPGQIAVAVVPNGTIAGLLDRSGQEHEEATLIVATLSGLPVPATALPPISPFVVLAVYDVRGVDLGTDDLVKVTFEYPDTPLTRAMDFAGVVPTLVYFNEQTGRLEVIRPSTAVERPVIIDRANRRITVVFDDTSVPRLTVFNGTPVAVVAPASFQLQSAPPASAPPAVPVSGASTFAAAATLSNQSAGFSASSQSGAAPIALALGSTQGFLGAEGGDEAVGAPGPPGAPGQPAPPPERDLFWPWQAAQEFVPAGVEVTLPTRREDRVPKFVGAEPDPGAEEASSCTDLVYAGTGDEPAGLLASEVEAPAREAVTAAWLHRPPADPEFAEDLDLAAVTLAVIPLVAPAVQPDEPRRPAPASIFAPPRVA